jgi:predicted nucleic acid-binding protein
MVPIAVLDANVLFPMILRDTLLRVAAAGCYRAHWSGRILEEMSRNLVAQHRVTVAQSGHLAEQMKWAFPEGEVDGWEPLEAAMPNDPKDRHVAAAAAHIGAAFIITDNLKDFSVLPDGIRAVGPDAFLVDRLASMPNEVIDALSKQAASYRNPPTGLDALLEWLERDIPDFVKAARDTAAAGAAPR